MAQQRVTVRTADLEELVADISGLPEALRSEVHERGLDEAGRIIAEYQRGSLAAEGLIDTGELLESITIKKGKGYVDVYPNGKRKNGSRNEIVAHVLEVGRRPRPGKGLFGGVIKETEWMGKAAEAAADDVAAAVADIYDEVLERLWGQTTLF